MLLSILDSFSEFPRNRFVKNGTANFGRNIPTEISGPLPEVIPDIVVRRNRNNLFHLNSDRNFRNLWRNGERPKKRLRRRLGARSIQPKFPG